MAYRISIRNKVIKVLQDINEPYYSKIGEAIYRLAITLGRRALRNLKVETHTVSALPITVSSMR